MKLSLPEDLLFVSGFIDFLPHIKVLIRYFLSVKNFAKNFSSSSCEILLSVEILIIFFGRFKNALSIARIF